MKHWEGLKENGIRGNQEKSNLETVACLLLNIVQSVQAEIQHNVELRSLYGICQSKQLKKIKENPIIKVREN